MKAKKERVDDDLRFVVEPDSRTYQWKSKLRWFNSVTRGQSSAYIVFLASLPCAFAIMIQTAGNQAWGLAIPTGIVWVIFLWLAIPGLKDRARRVSSVTLFDDHLTLQSPILNKRVSWLEVKEFLPRNSALPSEPTDHVLVLNTGEEFYIPDDFPNSSELFQTIETKAPKPIRNFTIAQRIDNEYAVGVNGAIASIIVALMFGTIKPFFLQSVAKQVAAQPQSSTEMLIGVAYASTISAVIVLIWLKLRSRIVCTIYATTDSLLIKTRSESFDLGAKQILAAHKLGGSLILKTSKGWFWMPGAGNFQRIEDLRNLLISWNLKVGKFATIKTLADVKRSRNKGRIAAFATIAIVVGIAAMNVYMKKANWHNMGLDKAGQYVITDRGIATNHPITALDIREVRCDPANVPPNAVIYADLLIGKQLHRELYRDETVTTDDLGADAGTEILAAEMKRLPHAGTSGSVKQQNLQIVVARKKIPAHTVINSSMVETKPCTECVRSSTTAELLGRRLNVSVPAGAIVPAGYAVLGTGQVLIARKAIAHGQAIKPSDIKISKMDLSSQPSSAIESIQALAGQVAAHDIQPGDLIRTMDIVPGHTN